MKKIFSFIKNFIIKIKNYYLQASGFQKTILCFLALFFITDIATISWGMFNFISWSPDDVSGFQALAFAKFGQNKYPPLATIIDLLLYAPILSAYWLAGIYHPVSGYPYGFTNPHIQMGILIMISRAMVFVYYAITGLVIYKTFKIFGKNISFLAATLYLLSPIIILFSTIGNVYSLMMLWVSLSLLMLLKLFLKKGVDKENKKLWMLFFFFLSLATGTKEEGVFILILPCIATLVKIKFFDKQPFKKLILDFLRGFAIFTLMYLVINRVITDFGAYKEYLKNWFAERDSWDKYPLYSGLEMLKQMAIGTFVSSPVLASTAIFGIIISFWQKKYRQLSIFVALALISRYLFLNSGKIFFLRHSMPTLLILSVYGGITIDWLWQKKYLKWLAVLIIILAFALALSPVIGKLNDARYADEKIILSITANKSVQFFTDKYHVYMPRIKKISESQNFLATKFVIDREFTEGFEPDLYVTEPKYYERFKDRFANYHIIYQTSPKKTPYYYRWAPKLNACRISCPTMILEKNK